MELTIGTDRANFADFICGTLFPNIQPFNGHSKGSVAVMDDSSIKHVDFIIKLFCEAGIPVIFLPPYSPDYNAIELTFRSIKAYLKDDATVLEKLPLRDSANGCMDSSLWLREVPSHQYFFLSTRIAS